MAAEVVYKEEEIIIIFNDSSSILDAEMTAIRLALENASETRDNITIHTDSLTAVNILNNREKHPFHFLGCLSPKTINNLLRHTILSIDIVHGMHF